MADTSRADEVSQYYDNLIGKLIVWGSDRATAIARMSSALQELHIEGVATTAPAQAAILAADDFRAGEHSTKWVEERLDLSGIAGSAAAPDTDDGGSRRVRRSALVEVNGKRFDVVAWVPENAGAGQAQSARPRRSAAGSSRAGDGRVTAPMQGTIAKVLVAIGDVVEASTWVIVLEAHEDGEQSRSRNGRNGERNQCDSWRHRRRRRCCRHHRVSSLRTEVFTRHPWGRHESR